MTAVNNETRKGIQIVPLIFALIIPLLIGGLSSLLTSGNMEAYNVMKAPPLAPPGWLFPVVWTILYVLMGLASYLVFVSDAEPDKKRKALMFYGAQLIMNLFWSTLFFTFGQYLIALIWLLVMWALIIVCVVRFYNIRKAAGLMMGGLFLWTTFAAYLNLAYLILSL